MKDSLASKQRTEELIASNIAINDSELIVLNSILKLENDQGEKFALLLEVKKKYIDIEKQLCLNSKETLMGHLAGEVVKPYPEDLFILGQTMCANQKQIEEDMKIIYKQIALSCKSLRRMQEEIERNNDEAVVLLGQHICDKMFDEDGAKND